MKIYANADEAKEILVRGKFDDAAKVAAVKEIVRDVQKRGDKALFAYAEKFDGSVLTADTVRVSEKEYQNAYKEVSEDFLVSLKKAVKNVYDYHARNPLQSDIRTENGRTTGYVVRPVRRAGIYVPGGTAPLSSSVLMLSLIHI